MDDRFISGIYNYCDGWCERCRFTDRCLNFSMGEEQDERRRAQGEDPRNWDAVVEDVGHNLLEALAMLYQMAEEEGIDVDAPGPPMPDVDVDDHPLQRLAWGITQRSEAFVGRLVGILEAERAALDSLSESHPEEREISLMRLGNNAAVVNWYHTLLGPKTHRALRGQALGEMGSPVSAEFRFDDARGTAKLLHECLGKSMGALSQIRKAVPELDEETQVLLQMAHRLREGIVAAVPHCLEYHRPGLDD